MKKKEWKKTKYSIRVFNFPYVGQVEREYYTDSPIKFLFKFIFYVLLYDTTMVEVIKRDKERQK